MLISAIKKFFSPNVPEEETFIPLFPPRSFETVNGKTVRICWFEKGNVHGYLEGCPGMPLRLSWNRYGACLENSLYDLLGSGSGNMKLIERLSDNA